MTAIDPAACADAYRALRERVCELVRSVDPGALDAIAPATPEWRVRDVLAHMVGVNADILSGTLEGVATDAWTAIQVDTRAGHDVAQMLDEWSRISPEVEANSTLLGPAVGQWVFDACTHEHDIRHALGRPGARESGAVEIGFEWGTDRIADALAASAEPGITVHSEVGSKELGDAPHTTVTASRFEIVRAMTGRRSRAQIEGFGWEGTPRADHLVLGIFTTRDDDFVE